MPLVPCHRTCHQPLSPLEQGGPSQHSLAPLYRPKSGARPSPSCWSGAALLPEHSQVHFCPADGLKIETISLLSCKQI